MPFNWDHIEKRAPGAIAAAFDGSGMFVAFDGACVYHGAANAWLPVDGCTKHSIGLVPINGDFTASSTLEIKPGCEETFRNLLEGIKTSRTTPTPPEVAIAIPAIEPGGKSHLANPLEPTTPSDTVVTPVVAGKASEDVNLTDTIRLLYNLLPKAKRAVVKSQLEKVVGKLE